VKQKKKMSVTSKIAGLGLFKKFETLQDHTHCDWYINQIQLSIVRTLENSNAESKHWFSEILKHDLLNMLGQAKNQIKRNCIMRTGDSYTHQDDINLRLLPKPTDWIPPLEAELFKDKNLNQIDEEITPSMTQKQLELKDDLKSACCQLQIEFSKILKCFYKKSATLEMTSRIATCVLLDYRMDLLKFINLP
jgi:hypothetical protein